MLLFGSKRESERDIYSNQKLYYEILPGRQEVKAFIYHDALLVRHVLPAAVNRRGRQKPSNKLNSYS